MSGSDYAPALVYGTGMPDPTSKRKKAGDPASETLIVLSANLRAIIAKSEMTATAWARKFGFTQSTIQRILTNNLEPTTHTIEQVAAAAKLYPWQLLVPGLDPWNPPMVLHASAAEAAWQAELMKLRERVDSLEHRS